MCELHLAQQLFGGCQPAGERHCVHPRSICSRLGILRRGLPLRGCHQLLRQAARGVPTSEEADISQASMTNTTGGGAATLRTTALALAGRILAVCFQ